MKILLSVTIALVIAGVFYVLVKEGVIKRAASASGGSTGGTTTTPDMTAVLAAVQGAKTNGTLQIVEGTYTPLS